jgi:outer membrane receptor protein involved in Fe transport
VRNATDKHYWTSSLHVNDVLLRYTGMPRTYGVTVTYRFE